MLIVANGETVDMDVHLPLTEISATRLISSAAFLELWTAPEVAATMAIDSTLQYAALGAIAAGTVNLDSPRLAGLLALAVSKGTLKPARADQITAGTPPA